MEYTPENITSLKSNEIFVYGSNQYSAHAGGAALFAERNFGAMKGIAPMGLCGQAYGIITTSFNEMKVKLEFIEQQVVLLYEFAKLRPDLVFIVTKIGTNLAGFTINDIAHIFHQLEWNKPNNIILPKEFHQ